MRKFLLTNWVSRLDYLFGKEKFRLSLRLYGRSFLQGLRYGIAFYPSPLRMGRHCPSYVLILLIIWLVRHWRDFGEETPSGSWLRAERF